MTLADIPAGASVFVDANIFVFALTNHAVHGTACNMFLDRAENQEIAAITSIHILGEVVHRLMTIEAADRFGWPVRGIANRLRRHPSDVQQLVLPRQGLDEINAARVSVLAIDPPFVALATDVCGQTGLLFGDGLTVTVMQRHGLTNLASHDSDFDRVPGISRYTPT